MSGASDSDTAPGGAGARAALQSGESGAPPRRGGRAGGVPARGENTDRVVPFTTEDGVDLNVINVRGEKPPTRPPVLLVHGAGVRANIFRAPVESTIVDALLAKGYDVWLENWRASIDFPPRGWTLDQAALYDHPAAVRTVVSQTGHERIKAIIHCQGSTSFAMSACAGLVPQVDTIVTNAVSLHTVVPTWSVAKARFATPLVQRIFSFINPGWGDHPPDAKSMALVALVKAGHHECRNTVCKMVSFTYGSGFPALWRHENLNDETHDSWLAGEFGNVPLTFFEQMARCIDRGHLVSTQGFAGLPEDYVAQEPQTDARFAFFAGELNRCFLPESQRRSYEHLSRYRPGYHSLHVLPGYSHLDMFFGRNAARDVHPLMVSELEHAVPG